jgi:FHA domain
LAISNATNPKAAAMKKVCKLLESALFIFLLSCAVVTLSAPGGLILPPVGLAAQVSEPSVDKPDQPVQIAQLPTAKPPDREKTLAVTEKNAWMIGIILALIVIALIAALIFFFIQNLKRKGSGASDPVKAPDIPEAQLEDLDKVCGEDHLHTKLDKAKINIGRSRRNDIVIAQPAISGFHASIEFRNMAFFLKDLRSTNGTKLNGRRLPANEPIRLKNGDRITFAKYNFKFVVVGQIPFSDTVMMSMTALADTEAEATVVLDLDGTDSKQGLISCLQNHLMQIYALGPKHRTFVNAYFAHDTLDIIATTAHVNLQQTRRDADQHCTPIAKNKAFYLVCSLPAAIDKAADWFGIRYEGYARFIFKWIRSEQYRTAQADQLCVITFGQDPATWVSITIVPTHTEPDPVEIMSVDFLNEEEKSSLALDFDPHGRVI